MGSEKIKLWKSSVWNGNVTFQQRKSNHIQSIHHLLTKRWYCWLCVSETESIRGTSFGPSQCWPLSKTRQSRWDLSDRSEEAPQMLHSVWPRSTETNKSSRIFYLIILGVCRFLRVWMCLAKVNPRMYFGKIRRAKQPVWNKRTHRLALVRHGIDAFFPHFFSPHDPICNFPTVL